MEETRRDVHMVFGGGAGVGEEPLPVPWRRLVRTSLAGGDQRVEGHSDRRDRGGEQVGVGVREDGQTPAALSQLGERARHLGKWWPGWKRFGEGVSVALGHREAVDRRHGGQAASQHLSVGELAVLLDAGLDRVVKAQQSIGAGLGPKRRERAPQAPLPVDQGSVAVERHPSVRHRRPTIFAAIDSPPGHPEIVRIVAPNPGPMTLEGTNTYVVGSDPAYVIDPGPADEAHLEAVRAAAEDRGGIAGVLLTHSHADHSAAVPMLGAPLLFGEVGAGDETSGEPGAERRSAGSAWPPSRGAWARSRSCPTPGHATDHVCFLLGEVGFCGDLVLGHGSSFVPPDGGSLAAYLDSLERLRAADLELLCPGHGPYIEDPAAKIDEYLEHRLMRERRLLAALEQGERSRARLLDRVWDDVPAELRPAAAVVMQAHLEKLEAEGRLPEGVCATEREPQC